MWEVAADFDVPIVVPFLSGPDPRQMQRVERDPVETIVEFFAARLADADRYGRRNRCILDPGTGFAPPSWPWEERYRYQKHVYSNLDALRRFGRPLYIALPWKETAQHDELLELVVRQQPEYARAHYPRKVREFEHRLSVTAADRGRGRPRSRPRTPNPADNARVPPRTAGRARSHARRSAGAGSSARATRW